MHDAVSQRGQLLEACCICYQCIALVRGWERLRYLKQLPSYAACSSFSDLRQAIGFDGRPRSRR